MAAFGQHVPAVKPCATHRAWAPQCSSTVGLREGASLGKNEGLSLGLMLGLPLGSVLGEALGDPDGDSLGLALGLRLGETVACDGDALGASVGDALGAREEHVPGTRSTFMSKCLDCMSCLITSICCSNVFKSSLRAFSFSSFF